MTSISSVSSLSSNFDSFDSFRDIDLFNSSLSCSDSKIRQFNDVTSFLRNLEHCQKLYRYRRTKLLEYMLWVLNDFVWKWFKKRSHFNFLPRFDMILTKTFSSQKQRELESIAQKRTKRKVRKIAKRVELNDIETAKQTSTFQDFDIFDLSLAFDRFEFDLYSNVAIFLQHLEQCQHLYRKSNLLNLLSKCLCDFVVEWLKLQSKFISLKRFNRVLTKAFPSAEIFSRRASSSSSNLQLSTLDVISESTEKSTTCRHCDETFNFKKSLREHKREQHRRKSIESSLLSINTLNSMCEDEKKSFVTHVSFVPSARSQKSIFESAVAFEAVTLLKRSTLQSLALETTSESTKRLSACRHCKQTFNFKKMLRKHKREQHAKRSVVSSHLLIDAVKSACESMKISTVNSSSSASLAVQSKQVSELFTFFELSLFASLDIFNSARSHQNSEKRRFNQIVIFIQHLQQCQHLYDESKLLEWMKVILCDSVDIWFENQSNFIFLHDFDIALTKTFSERSNLSLSTLKTESESTKRSATCRHCKQTFKFKELLRKHKREQHAKKSVINSSLRSHALKSVCKVKKKSTVKNVTTLFASQELQISTQKSQKIDVQKSSIISSFLSTTTINSTCKVAEKSTIISIAETSKITSEQRVEWRSRTAYLFTRLKASRLNFSLNTFVTISETMKSASIQEVACARAMCRSCKQNFSFNNELFEHIREHEILKRINDFHFSIDTVKSTCEAVKKSTNACSSFSQKSSILSATSRNLVTDIRISLQSVSSKDSNFSIATFKFTSECVKNASIQRIVCVRTTCKRCKQIFNFNNKLHEHLRQNHARKSVKSSDLRALAFEFTYKVIEKSAVFCSSVSLTSQSISSTSSATSRSQIFSAKMFSRSVSFKDSHLSIATLKITSKSVKKLSANCQLTFSFSSFRISVRKHHESHMQKSYLIMNDLSRMFTEKSKSFDLRSHQDRSYSSQSFDIRQSSQSCFSIASKKSYLTIENLFEMFREKFKRKSMFQNQKNVSSREFFSEQSRITVYFKSTVNQKSSINQDSKSSKSKSLNQHMSTKSIRIAFSKDLSEKSIDLSYKLSDFFYSKDLFEKSVNLSYELLDVFWINMKFFVEISFFIFVFLRLLSIFLLALAFVSTISAAKMNCINVYEQVISIIDRVIQ